jgi:protein-tyrosine phosphatase
MGMLPILWRRIGRPDLTPIVTNLLIGEYPTPGDVPWLCAAHGVTAVLSLQDDADLASKGLELAELEYAYRAHGVRFERLPVPDCDTDFLAARLDLIVAALTQLIAGGACVYLHCNAGMNRAPTVAIAFLHAVRGLPLAAARDFVKSRRPCAPYMTVLETRYLQAGR